MRFVGLDCDAFSYEPVAVAETFLERLRGLSHRPRHWAMLLPGSSVHTSLMRRELSVIALDRGLRVVAARQLEPMSVWRVRGAGWMLEVPTAIRLPRRGDEIVLVPLSHSELGEHLS